MEERSKKIDWSFIWDHANPNQITFNSLSSSSPNIHSIHNRKKFRSLKHWFAIFVAESMERRLWKYIFHSVRRSSWIMNSWSQRINGNHCLNHLLSWWDWWMLTTYPEMNWMIIIKQLLKNTIMMCYKNVPIVEEPS